MPAPTSAFAPVEQCDEVLSTSCTEDDALLDRQTTAKSRGVWKVALVATATGLIAAAGMWRNHSETETAGGETVGDEATGLDSTWAMYGTIGCSNWEPLEITRKVVPDKSACATLCKDTDGCTSFNWQQDACEPGWFVANGCLLFKGDCKTERNVCWELDYKIEEAETTVTQTIDVQTSATAAEAEAAVADALAEQNIAPVTTSSTPGRRLQQQDRRLQQITTLWNVKWIYKTNDDVKADHAYDYAVKVSTDQATGDAFVASCEAALPDGSTFAVTGYGEPVKESGGTTETPDWGSTTMA